MNKLSENLQSIIKRIHINVPWSMLDRYLNLVTTEQMNVEIGFAAKDLDDASPAELKAVAARLKKRGCALSLHGPFWDLCPGSQDKLIRQVTYLRLQQFIDVVAILEPVQVVCHTGYDPYHHRGNMDSWLDRSSDIWTPLVKRVEGYGVPLLLENVWEHDPLFIVELLKRMGSNWFGFCLDVGHQNSFSKTSLATWLGSTADFLKEIHLHDNDGSEDSHLPIGQGNIDFIFLFQFLRQRGLKPLLTLEPHQENHLHESLTGLDLVFTQLTAKPAITADNVLQKVTSWP
jgi:sugar phosphate isomerase/epimerase